MKALLTAFTAIASAATQVTWLDVRPAVRAPFESGASAQPGAAAVLPRARAGAVSAQAASARVAPAPATAIKS